MRPSIDPGYTPATRSSSNSTPEEGNHILGCYLEAAGSNAKLRIEFEVVMQWEVDNSQVNKYPSFYTPSWDNPDYVPAELNMNYKAISKPIKYDSNSYNNIPVSEYIQTR